MQQVGSDLRYTGRQINVVVTAEPLTLKRRSFESTVAVTKGYSRRCKLPPRILDLREVIEQHGLDRFVKSLPK
jgi:hypothetical protein